MHILILRPAAIGDTLLTFPVIQALRTQYKNPHITFVGNAALLPLAQAWSIVDAVSDYEDIQWSELFSPSGIRKPALREQLRHTDLAICWLRDPDNLVAQNLREAGVQRIIVAPGRPSPENRIHAVDYLAQSIGLHDDTLSSHLAFANTLNLSGTRLVKAQPTIALHPGSGGAQKCWPVTSFAAVIERLWQHNLSILLLAGPADHQRLAQLQKLLPPPSPPLLTILLDAPLITVAQHLQSCQCYLGNDSGITHLAAMLGVPTTVLFGPTDPLIWCPLGPSVTIIQAPDLQRLPINMVVELMLTRLLS